MGVELVEGQDLFVRTTSSSTCTTSRVAAGGRDLPPVDDDFLDPLGLPPRFGARRTRPVQCLPRRGVVICNAIGHRRRRRQVDLPLRAGDDPFLPGRAHPEQRAHLGCAASRTTCKPCWPPGELVVKEVTGRAATACWSGPTATPGRDRGFRRAPRPNPDGLHRPADARPVELPDLRRHRHRAAPHRPAALRAAGKTTVQLVPGGLTAWRLKEGSLVENAFQNCRPPVLAQPLHIETGQKHRPHAGHPRTRPSLQPRSQDEAARTWRSQLRSRAGRRSRESYDKADSRSVMQFMVADENNLSSIFCCLRAARETARAVRRRSTTEVWETMSQTWLEFREAAQGATSGDPGTLFEWVKYRSHLSRGVTVGTMLQDKPFASSASGSFLERADSTAACSTSSSTATQQLRPPARPTRRATSTTGRPCCARSRSFGSIARSTATSSSPRGGRGS